MSLPRYAEYKDSGVEWLGEVPAGWRVDRLKASITSCRNGIWGGDPTGDADDIECVRVADFDRARLVVDGEVPTLRSVTAKERANRLVTAGELLLEKSGGGEKQPVGQVVLYDRAAQAVCSNFVAKVTLASGMVPRYWMYQHAAAYARGVNVGSIKQTSGIQNLDQSQYFNERGVFPSEKEQSAIAAFLDRETGKIDALIAEQEMLLTLLAEKRQATIAHAVTRGLTNLPGADLNAAFGGGPKGEGKDSPSHPNAPMKDSGIIWLGEVPTHWRVTKCGRFLSILSGYAFPSAGFDHSGSGTKLLRGVNVAVGSLRWDDVVYWERSIDDGLDEYGLRCGDLVIGMDRPLIAAGMRVGKVKEEDVPCLLLQRVALLRTSSELNSDFLMHWLSTSMFVAHFSPETTGVSVPHISPDQIASFVIAFPSIDEQKKIVDFVDDELIRLTLLHQQSEQAVQLLKERRSALIAAAVTGKIDVRCEV